MSAEDAMGVRQERIRIRTRPPEQRPKIKNARPVLPAPTRRITQNSWTKTMQSPNNTLLSASDASSGVNMLSLPPPPAVLQPKSCAEKTCLLLKAILAPSAVRLLAHRRMALSALTKNSSLFVRLKRYNAHMDIVRTLEAQGGAQ